MREIKFRAWDGEKMRFVSRLDFDNETFDMVMRTPTQSAPQHWKLGKIKDNPLMQYTGLKDKNGVEIYEGDICAFTNPYINRSFIREVKFCPMFACFGLYKKDGSVYDYESDWLKITNIEVIGNIYENPELLK